MVAQLQIMSKFDDKQSDFIAAWFAGNIWGDEWPFVIAFLPWVLIIIPYLLFKSNTLNIIHTGDNIARGLGVRLSRERLILFFIAVMLSSAAVAVAGSISFIGLMGPHIAKRIVGPRHQLFLPIAILVGACLLVIADTIGKLYYNQVGSSRYCRSNYWCTVFLIFNVQNEKCIVSMDTTYCYERHFIIRLFIAFFI